MKKPAIMFQGTGSGVGKSILAAGFCRLLARMGVKAAPFKAQNMALNSGVAAEGLEMGRAQILQAEAAGIIPDVRMNPILLKPQGNSTSQLIRMGLVAGTFSAREYYTLTDENFEIVRSAYDSLSAEYDVLVLEGAGSPAEINLHKTDIVNMRMAEYAEADVYIIGDIDRGGVFAWMKGTYDLAGDDRQRLIKGFIINKFRGDMSLLEPGIEMFANLVPAPVVGTLPYLKLTLEEEDSQDISSGMNDGADVTVGIVRLPKISNFSDFAPLKSNTRVNLKYAETPDALKNCDVIIIPGSKSTLSDMNFLRESGLADFLKSSAGEKLIIGICGGFQMLGDSISDPKGIEGEPGTADGLGLIEMETVITDAKELTQKTCKGTGPFRGLSVEGYEMHMGRTVLRGSPEMLTEGALSVYDSKRKIIGTYLHGIFGQGDVTGKIFEMVGYEIPASDYTYEKERQLDLVADTISEYCDMDMMLRGLL